MTLFALVLILFSALLHSVWNLILKKVGGGPEFTWFFSMISLVLFAPAAFLSFRGLEALTPAVLGIIAFSALCETGYYLALQRAYLKADLSVVYPIARGTGPLLTVLLSSPILGEAFGPGVLFGTILVLSGSLFLASKKNQPTVLPPVGGIAPGLLAGIFICGYTLVDKAAVSMFGLPPVFYFWAVLFFQVLLLTPLAAIRREALRDAWIHKRREALAIGILCPLAYLLVLWALSFTPVNRIAPSREIGIVFGTFLGARFLGEKGFRGRLLASAAVFAGILLLAAR
jgi:drug/metabolite transporter (DMT)-like permease